MEKFEDLLVHPYWWLRPDLVPPAPFISCDPEDTVDGSGVLVEPHAIDEHLRKAWMPFCRGAWESADLDAFRAVAEDLTPLFDEVNLPPLSGDMLHDAVQRKKPTAGSLNSWGWRPFRLLGLNGWPLSSLWWRKMGFGLIACWMPTLPWSPSPMGTPPLWANDHYVSCPLPSGSGLLLDYSICRFGLSLWYRSRY